jgi:hypothetical protein
MSCAESFSERDVQASRLSLGKLRNTSKISLAKKQAGISDVMMLSSMSG